MIKRVKEWWNNFKEDLVFNIIMVLMSGSILLVWAIEMFKFIKEAFGIC